MTDLVLIRLKSVYVCMSMDGCVGVLF